MIQQPVFIKMPDKQVSLSFLAEILDTAEGEINAWCDVVSSTSTADPEYRRVEIIVSGAHKTLDLETIQRGIERMMREYNPKIHIARTDCGIPSFGQVCEWLIISIQDGDTSMVDAAVADLVIQYALFGEMVYA